MGIESLDELGAALGRRCREAGWAIRGPASFEWGYGWSPNITFWSGDRRVHFFFESMHGRIYVIVECGEVGPPRRAVVSRIQEVDEAFLILSQFLRKRCDFADLPGDEWLSDVPTHDERIPHPPEAEAPEAEVEPVRSAAGGVAGLTGVVLYSNDARRLARWYSEMLGAELREEGGQFAGNVGSAQFSIQSSETPIASGTRPVLLSYAVREFDGFVGDLAARGAEILGLEQTSLGKFAYTRDSDGNPIEIWGR